MAFEIYKLDMILQINNLEINFKMFSYAKKLLNQVSLGNFQSATDHYYIQ